MRYSNLQSRMGKIVGFVGFPRLIDRHDRKRQVGGPSAQHLQPTLQPTPVGIDKINAACIDSDLLDPVHPHHQESLCPIPVLRDDKL